MRKIQYAVLAGGLALAGCGLAGPAYPNFGATPFKIEGVTTPIDGGPATHTVIYRDGAKLRVETTLPQRGQATIVFDDASGGAYVLNPVTLAANTASPPAPLNTANTATTPAAPPPNVVGVAVRIPDSDAPQPLETPWAALGASNAKNVGGCNVANERGNEWESTAPATGASPRAACITADGIVLRVREGDKVIFQATRLERGPIAANMFGIPVGYSKVDPEAVGDSVDNAVGDLDSVTSTPPATTATTPSTPPRN